MRTHFTTDPTAIELLATMKKYMAERKAASQKNKPAGAGKGGKKNKKGGNSKKGGGNKAPAGPAPILDATDSSVITCLDIRVGKILNCKASARPCWWAHLVVPFVPS